MSLLETRYEHVVLDETGTPFIAGTRIKVVEIVLSYLSSGSSPEELHLHYPALALGQLYSALAYYWDHKAKLDEDIERRLQRVDALKQSIPISPLLARLKHKT
jgi:uncharacterized protein (DUF433 family)